MQKLYLGFILAGMGGLLISGCGMLVNQTLQASQTPYVVTELVTVIVVVTATPGAELQQSSEQESVNWVLPVEVLDYVGSKIRVKVESAQCSFQENINGSPTFCNDQPFPNHNFTFLVWEEDWSHLDQTCVVVEGLVELFQGKPQIEVRDPEQVTNCAD